MWATNAQPVSGEVGDGDYDADGRPTGTTSSTAGAVDADGGQSMTWSPIGKLSTLTVGDPGDPQHSTGYGYDVDGNLAARTIDGAITLYLGADTIHLSGGTVTEVDRAYAFPHGPTAVRVATTSGSTLHRHGRHRRR